MDKFEKRYRLGENHRGRMGNKYGLKVRSTRGSKLIEENYYEDDYNDKDHQYIKYLEDLVNSLNPNEIVNLYNKLFYDYDYAKVYKKDLIYPEDRKHNVYKAYEELKELAAKLDGTPINDVETDAMKKLIKSTGNFKNIDNKIKRSLLEFLYQCFDILTGDDIIGESIYDNKYILDNIKSISNTPCNCNDIIEMLYKSIDNNDKYFIYEIYKAIYEFFDGIRQMIIANYKNNVFYKRYISTALKTSKELLKENKSKKLSFPDLHIRDFELRNIICDFNFSQLFDVVVQALYYISKEKARERVKLLKPEFLNGVTLYLSIMRKNMQPNFWDGQYFYEWINRLLDIIGPTCDQICTFLTVLMDNYNDECIDEECKSELFFKENIKEKLESLSITNIIRIILICNNEAEDKYKNKQLSLITNYTNNTLYDNINDDEMPLDNNYGDIQDTRSSVIITDKLRKSYNLNRFIKSNNLSHGSYYVDDIYDSDYYNFDHENYNRANIYHTLMNEQSEYF